MYPESDFIKPLPMENKAIQSKINKVAAELTQLKDRNYFTEEQEQQKRPALQAELEKLENDYLNSLNNTEVNL